MGKLTKKKLKKIKKLLKDNKKSKKFIEFENEIFKMNYFNPCDNCINNKPGKFNICHCTLPYMNQTTC